MNGDQAVYKLETTAAGGSSVGKYDITVLYRDGETSGTFEITAKTTQNTESTESTESAERTGNSSEQSPAMGDNSSILLWVALLPTGYGGLLAVYKKRKRANNNL